jgi:hypothetical protein
LPKRRKTINYIEMGCGGSSEETQGQEVPEEDFDLHREVQFANEG